MFGDVIGAKAGAIVLFDELEPRLEQIPERNAVIVEMIENTELERHGLSSLSLFINGEAYRSAAELPTSRLCRRGR
jgi:hypothetical protein